MPADHVFRAAAAALLALVSFAARADSMRCGGRLVSAGDSKRDLLGKCGGYGYGE
jgi:hypothetical protein